ncbi:MAG: hypothetical protein WEC75_03520 [Dehalococcoidia bacterium]
MVAQHVEQAAVMEWELERPTLMLVRQDALPEHMAYRDTGCELSPSCLRCPLARCKYDEPGGARRMRTERRDREIARLRRRHRVPVDMLAQTYGITRRSVFRILRGTRE